ncbi:HAMP domain-containing protein [Desulfohalovibrio reitneri]|uniref:HAMP domain-containing protein n=1 Tax=Desulfohalovibrio reitneri TaxID=1307759 RepID=UPI00110E964E|nr:HAMP domain-containing protein [Desulfohalovibrio reitneri]
MAGVLAVLLAAGAIGWISRRMITKPVEQIEDFSRRVAGGDYSTRLEGSFKFELGQLADHLRDMVEAFKRGLGFSRGLQSSLTTACLFMDRHEKLTFVNQEYLDLFGKPGKPEDYQGMTLAELFYGDANKETVAGKAMSRNRSFRDMEMETKAQDGSEVFVRYDVAPCRIWTATSSALSPCSTT